MRRLIPWLAALAVLPAFVYGGAWQPVGPGGGTISGLAVSAANNERVYASGPNGLFRSDDHALNWTDISVGLPLRGDAPVAVSPVDADVLYTALAGRIYRSLDAGQTWRSARPGPPAAAGRPTQLAVVPGGSDELRGAFADGLYHSDDGGNSWVRINQDPFHAFETFAVLPDNPDIVLAGGQLDASSNPQAFRSEDGGRTWQVVSISGAFSGDEYLDPDVAFFPAGGNGRVIALSDGAVYLSQDDGQVWMPPGNQAYSGLAAETVVISPDNPDSWLVGGRNGILWTNDNGATASQVSGGLGPPGAQGAEAAVLDLALTPDGQNIYVGTEHAGLWWGFRSGGDIFARPAPSYEWSRPNGNAGLRQASIGALAVSPVDSGVVFAAYRKDQLPAQPSDLLWNTTDAGGNWQVVDDGIQASQLSALAIDPMTVDDPSTMLVYAAGWGHVRFPDGTVTTGVFRSDDSGAAWDTLGTGSGLPRGGDVPKFSVVLDPTSAAPHPFGGGELLSRLFVAGAGRIDPYDCNYVPGERIFRSIDFGDTWSAASSGLPIPPCIDQTYAAYDQDVHTLTMDATDPATLYAGLAIEVPEALASEPLDGNNGVYKTTDGGSNWVHMSSGLPRLDPNDPTSPHWDVFALGMGTTASNETVVYAVVQPVSRKTLSPGVRESRVYRSGDGGESWNNVTGRLPSDLDLRVLLVDPENAERVYVAGRGTPSNPGGVYFSSDGGMAWRALGVGLRTASVEALALNRSGSRPVLYAGTSGGVYRLEQLPDGDGDGVPDFVEDGAPNNGDGNDDGLADNLQANVSSLPVAGPGPQRGANSYMTIEILGAANREAGRGSPAECEWLWNAETLPEEDFPADTWWEYPFGMVRFEVPACAGAELRLEFHGLDSGGFDELWQFRVFAPDQPGDIDTIRWQQLPGAQRDGKAWVIDLGDGELGDLLTANGTIKVQGGAAQSTQPDIFNDRFEDAGTP